MVHPGQEPRHASCSMWPFTPWYKHPTAPRPSCQTPISGLIHLNNVYQAMPFFVKHQISFGFMETWWMKCVLTRNWGNDLFVSITKLKSKAIERLVGLWDAGSPLSAALCLMFSLFITAKAGTFYQWKSDKLLQRHLKITLHVNFWFSICLFNAFVFHNKSVFESIRDVQIDFISGNVPIHLFYNIA